MKNTKEQQRSVKENEYRKELKRFDPILKEIFSKAAAKLISIATGEKIHKKLEDITAEIEFVKSLRPDLLLRTKEKFSILKYKYNLTKLYPKGCLYILLQLRENSEKNLYR